MREAGAQPWPRRFSVTVALTDSKFEPQPGAEYLSITGSESDAHALFESVCAAAKRAAR